MRTAPLFSFECTLLTWLAAGWLTWRDAPASIHYPLKCTLSMTLLFPLVVPHNSMKVSPNSFIIVVLAVVFMYACVTSVVEHSFPQSHYVLIIICKIC